MLGSGGWALGPGGLVLTWRPGAATLSVAPWTGGGVHAWAAPSSVSSCAKQMANVFSLSPSFLKAKILFGFL